MTVSLEHRGPDAQGTWIDERAGIGLGHRRLSILDLTPTGSQPMVSADGRYTITFNGEIYNFHELREELESLGNSFRGTSDTEVMLASFSQWGIEASLKKFIGMFAFGVWDRDLNELTLARDRFGEKPLYYGWTRSTFLFASEIKSLAVHPNWAGEIDRDVLALYFRNNYIPAPFSIYQGIFKLPVGSYIRLKGNEMTPGDLPEPVAYWSLQRVIDSNMNNRFNGTDEEAIERVDQLLRAAVKKQQVSDVPLGVFFSGGIDSSAIVALMQAQNDQPVKTFTMGSKDIAYDEAIYAKEIARCLKTDHTEYYVSPQDAMKIVPLLPQIYDEPFADSSQIPSFLISQIARRSVTVCLTGDGGDEVFCGYNVHFMLQRIWDKIGGIPFSVRKSLSSLILMFPSSLYESILRNRKSGVLSDQVQKLAYLLKCRTPQEMYLRLTTQWNSPTDIVLGSKERATQLSDIDKWPDWSSFLDQIMYVASVTSLPDDMLVKMDRATMSNSLETRTPFLDPDVVEFVWRLPHEMKVRNNHSKWILRQVLYRYVPAELIDRPKSGFSVPIDEWLKGDLKGWAEELLDVKSLKDEGFLNPGPIREKWEEHLSGRRKWQTHLWGVLMFQAWLRSRKTEIPNPSAARLEAEKIN